MHAPVDAARHVENAIDLWDRVGDPEAASGTTLVELLRRAAELSFIGGEMDRAVGLARRALELIDDSDVVATVLARERLARYLWTSGHHSESDEAVHAGRRADAGRAAQRRARTRARRARAGAHAGRADRGLARAGRGGDRDRPGGRRPGRRVARPEHAGGGHRSSRGPGARHRGAEGVARHRAGARLFRRPAPRLHQPRRRPRPGRPARGGDSAGAGGRGEGPRDGDDAQLGGLPPRRGGEEMLAPRAAGGRGTTGTAGARRQRRRRLRSERAPRGERACDDARSLGRGGGPAHGGAPAAEPRSRLDVDLAAIRLRGPARRTRGGHRCRAARGRRCTPPHGG